MSLTKLIKSHVKLFFAKDSISFFLIRRYDLGIDDNRLKYIAIRPNASMSVIRQKLWYMLDLPDYCEEVLILKTDSGIAVPLTDLKKGNDPQHPFTLEVWSPGTRFPCAVNQLNMIAMTEGDCENLKICDSSCVSEEISQTRPANCVDTSSNYKKQSKVQENRSYIQNSPNILNRMSSTSVFFKLQSRKSRDNFATILLKIQNDLSNLNNKLSDLETRIPE